MKINELKAEIVRNDFTIEQFSNLTGIERTRLYRRFNNPNDLTLGEINRMVDVLNVKSDRVLEIFFSNKVS